MALMREDYRLQPGETVSKYLVPQEAASAPPAAVPAPAAAGATPEWVTPERQRMMDKARSAAQNYRRAVDQRRLKRKQAKDYSKLYNQYEKSIGVAEDLENLQRTYPELYPADDPRTLGLVRAQAKHVETAERLRQQLRQNLRRAGIQLGDKDPIPDNPFGDTDEDDRRFDSQIQQGYIEAMTSPYE